jgi:2-keto-4-pentenoate hydratase/2-oxohepta-3-ene-1,7-dioic acid hydratase in catechol pathway
MKFGTFTFRERRTFGVLDPVRGMAWPLDGVLGQDVSSMLELIQHYDEIKDRIRTNGHGVDLADVTLEAPIPRPLRNVFCVGKNYRDHAQEFTSSGFDSSAASKSDAVPTAPIIFTKAPESVIGPAECIVYPTDVSDCIDYEAELGVIVGTGGRGISRKDAYRHIWGYTIINDVTARDWQGRHKQWFLGKSFDTFCPMGPWAVTADEIDPENVDIKCWVNDELRQSANTRDLIFGIPELVETISAGMTLYPGDIIATGTPAGVGIGFTPPRYLAPGDRVRIEVQGIGTLSNTVAMR